MGLLHVGPAELEAQLELRRRRVRRVSCRNTHIEINDVCFDRDVAEPQFVIGADVLGFVTQLNVHSGQGYTQFRLDDSGLRELVDVITKYLQLPPQPVNVQVTLQQQQPRRRKKAPAATTQQLTEVELIKRRMLGGR